MTTVDTSGKIVRSIMTLKFQESPELYYIEFWCIYRGVSRISGKNVHMYKGTGSLFSFYHIFLKYPMKIKEFGLMGRKLFHFHRIFKSGGGGSRGGFKGTP